MPSINIQLDSNEIKNLIMQLKDNERSKLLNDIIEMDFKDAVKELRRNAKKNKITDKDIEKICERVRKRRYEKSCNWY